MRKRILGKNGPKITVVGLGTWAIGGPWTWGWGPQNDEDSISAILTSLENEVNWIDTAPVYGLGHAEEVIAKALQDWSRPEVFIATKCGLVWDDRQRVKRTLRPESIRKEIDQSLTRLKVDYVDLYQHHWPDPDTPVEDSWGEMLRLQEAGKVRYIGVCNYDVSLLNRCMQVAQVQSLQPPYSLLRREIENDLLPFCQQNDIGVVAYSPLQTGLLTGKIQLERLAPDDWRRKDRFFQEPKFSQAMRVVDALRPLASSLGVSLAQLAVAWVLAHPAVTAAIVGARNASQAAENVRAADVILPEEVKAQMDELARAFESGEM